MMPNSLDERKAMISGGVEKVGYNPLILKPEFQEGCEEVPRCEGD
jgi:hypothetical protein